MAKTKLKRDRLPAPSPDATPQTLPLMGMGAGRVEPCKPSRDDPALRRYIPAAGLDIESQFRELGILDWRSCREAGAAARIEDVADRIICADAERALSRLPDESVACVITSPPYWNVVDYGFEGQLGTGAYAEYLHELLGVWRECQRVLAPNGKLCINTPIMPIPKAVMPDQHTRHLKNLNNDIEATILQRLELQRYGLYLWQKQTTEKMFGSYPYPPNLYEQNTVEFINVLVKPGPPKKLPKAVKEHSRLTEKQWMNLTRQVWRMYPQDVKRANHPAPFPEALPNRLIAMYTFARCLGPQAEFPGDIVLDPFCGTGAACLAAKKLGRRYIGIDLSQDFVIETASRVRSATENRTVFLCQSQRVSADPEA